MDTNMCKAKHYKTRKWITGHYYSFTGKNVDWTGKESGKNETEHRIKKLDEIVSEVIDINTLCRYTGMHDMFYKDIYMGDRVDFLGIIGHIVFECGSYGVALDDVDYDLIQKKMDENLNCCNNKYIGCLNDNFISLWEIYWNFNCDEDVIDVIEIIGNVND